MTDKLNVILADAIVFYHKLHHYHWHVTGPGFFQLHEAFENLYDRWAEIVDDMAERVVTLGGQAHPTLAEALKAAGLAEDAGVPEAKQMVANVAADLQTQLDAIKQAAAAADDADDRATAGMMDELIADIEKRLWMLRAYTA